MKNAILILVEDSQSMTNGLMFVACLAAVVWPVPLAQL